MPVFSIANHRPHFLLGLMVMVITAYCSVGYNHPDEHFQILEFANYKLGNSPASDLTWEFAAQCRPALQPLIAFCISKIFISLGCFQPFWVAFVLRLIMGILIWRLTCQLIGLMLPKFKTDIGKNIFIGCSFFLWFVPYIGVRFSAENISALCLFTALLIILQIGNFSGNKKTVRLMAAGLLLGFGFFMRIQICFALAGVAIWILFIKKWPWKETLTLLAFGLIAIGVCVLADRWLYGNWVFTPFNYFKVNIIEHRAADFGVSPWWYYFTSFLQTAVPPLSLVLFCFFFVGIYKKPSHLFSILSITFLLGHMLIGHKELRFLFPINMALIFLACYGIDSYFQRNTYKPIHRFLLRCLMTINFALLLFRTFAPAQEAMKYYEYIYNYAQQKEVILMALERSPYNTVGAEVNFYKPKNIQVTVVQNTFTIDSIYKNNPNKALLFFSTNLTVPAEISGYKLEKLYCLLPDWVLKFNVNHWQDRSNIGVIYRLQR